jgi:hypothetical protein
MHPVLRIYYPGTIHGFDKWFSSEDACLEYIPKLRWPQGFICPGCDEKADQTSLMEQAIDCRPVPRKMIIGGQTQ